MDPETAALFDRMSADTDLADEIKLLRTCLALLTDDLRKNWRQILQTMAALFRAVQLQLKLHARMPKLEQLLRERGEQVLRTERKRDE